MFLALGGLARNGFRQLSVVEFRTRRDLQVALEKRFADRNQKLRCYKSTHLSYPLASLYACQANNLKFYPTWIRIEVANWKLMYSFGNMPLPYSE